MARPVRLLLGASLVRIVTAAIAVLLLRRGPMVAVAAATRTATVDTARVVMVPLRLQVLLPGNRHHLALPRHLQAVSLGVTVIPVVMTRARATASLLWAHPRAWLLLLACLPYSLDSLEPGALRHHLLLVTLHHRLLPATSPRRLLLAPKPSIWVTRLWLAKPLQFGCIVA